MHLEPLIWHNLFIIFRGRYGRYNVIMSDIIKAPDHIIEAGKDWGLECFRVDYSKLYLAVIFCLAVCSNDFLFRYSWSNLRQRFENYSFLFRPFKEKTIHRDCFLRHENLMLAITSPFLNIFFIKLSKYIAYDNTVVKIQNSLGQGHIWMSYTPLYTRSFYFDKVQEGDTSNQLNTHLVYHYNSVNH
jgi:hypothetical protein